MQSITFRLTLVAASIAMTGCAGVQGLARKDLEPKVVPFQSIQHAGRAVDVHYAIGRDHMSRGDANAALDAFDAALAIDPSNGEARNGRANALAAQGRLDLAIDELRRAIVESPNAAHLQNNLGFLLLEQGHHAEAAVVLRRALVVDPANARAIANWSALVRRSPSDAPWLNGEDPSLARRATGRTAPDDPRVSSVVPAHMGVVDLARPQRLEGAPSNRMVPGHVDAPTAGSQSGPATSPAVVSVSFGPLPGPVDPARADALRSIPAASPTRRETGFPSTRSSASDGSRSASNAELGVQTTPMAVFPAKRPVASVVSTGVGANDQMGKLEISNGAGVERLARRTAAMLRRSGVQVARVTNHRNFNQTKSTIRYRDGRRDQAIALQKRFGLPDSAVIRDDAMASGIDTRLILGHDLRGRSPLDRTTRADYLEPLREQALALQALLDATFI